MKKIFCLLFILVGMAFCQMQVLGPATIPEIIVNLETSPPIITFPAVLTSTVGNENIVPLVLYQTDSIIIGVPYAFSKWITCADNGAAVKMGTLPTCAVILGIQLWVEEKFNAIGADLMTVGHAEDSDAYLVLTDVSSKGIKTNGNVADGVRIGKSEEVPRVVYAYYNGAESNPTEGKALIILRWMKVDAKP